MPLTRDEDIDELLANARTIAMVGASDRPDRASNGVMKFLQDHGYRVIPVNPQITGEHVTANIVWRELGPDRRTDRHRRHFPPPDAAGEAVDKPSPSAPRRSGCNRRHQRGSGRARRSGRAQGRHGPLPEDRDPAPRRAAGRPERLGGRHRHFRDQQGRAVDATPEAQVARRLERREHVLEVRRDGDLRDRAGDFAMSIRKPAAPRL